MSIKNAKYLLHGIHTSRYSFRLFTIAVYEKKIDKSHMLLLKFSIMSVQYDTASLQPEYCIKILFVRQETESFLYGVCEDV